MQWLLETFVKVASAHFMPQETQRQKMVNEIVWVVRRAPLVDAMWFVWCIIFSQNALFVKQNRVRLGPRENTHSWFGFYFRLTIWIKCGTSRRRTEVKMDMALYGGRQRTYSNVFPAGFIVTGFSVLCCSNICKRYDCRHHYAGGMGKMYLHVVAASGKYGALNATRNGNVRH